MKGLLAILVLGSAAYAQTPSVAAGGVLNAASFDKTQPVTPGSLISIFGSNLAATTATADTIPLSSLLGNVKVSINGTDAPLLFVSHSAANGDQINAQLPWGTTTGQAQVVVTNNGVASTAQTLQVGASAPGIFTVNFGTGPAIAINSDGSLAAPAGSIPGFATHPAKVGDSNGLIILATGLGAVDHTPSDGNSPQTLAQTVAKPVVLINGVPVQVTFSGLAPGFVGLNQVNV